MRLNDFALMTPTEANAVMARIKAAGSALPSPGKPATTNVSSVSNTLVVGKAQTVPRVAGRLNQTEARYAKERLEPRRLTGEILRYDYEPEKLRLADGTYLTPDWRVILRDGTVEFHEVKGGFTREDSWIKLKIAAELHPYIFRLCKYVKGFWTVTEVGR